MKVNIDRLQIRLKGVSPSMACEAVNGLGHGILEQLSTDSTFKQQGDIKIDTVQAGRIKLERNTSTANLRQQMAKSVSKAINSGSKES